MFGIKKNDTREKIVNSVEYEQLLKRFLDTDTNVKSVKSDIEVLRMEVASLRGKFSSAVRGIREKQEEEQKTESLSNSNELPFG